MIELGKDQLEAFDMVKRFVKHSSSQSCLYYGSAGTGKSLLLNEIVKWLEQEKVDYVLCAPTHKAALVMSRYTQREAITLHQLLALSPRLDIFDLDFNNLLFHSKNPTYLIPRNGVVICDESSMINDGLYELLLKKLSVCNTKLVFTGDFCQLQPVKQNNITKIKEVKPQFELKQIYRQSNESGLLETLATLREKSIVQFETSLGKDGNLQVMSNLKSFVKKCMYSYEEAMQQQDVLHTKVLCYTNKRVSEFNRFMHTVLFGNAEYGLGEFIVGCENVELPKWKKLYNSMDYIINCDPKSIDIDIPNFGILPGYLLGLYDSLTKETLYIKILSRDISTDELQRLANTIEYYRLTALEAKANGNKVKAALNWKQYYAIVESFATPVDLYYEGRLVKKKTLDYGYAVSVHKSQGSTYNNVFIDIDNINTCRDSAVLRQLQYVALSRTKKDAFVYQKED